MTENKIDLRKEILGMPFGTAASKLRKNILFSLVQELKKDKCFKCKFIIEAVEVFSIEHKMPWQSNRSKELFWDLDNISFSHMKCNKPHKYNGGGKFLRKIGSEGTTWCSNHQSFFNTNEFYKNKNRWNGFAPECKSCAKEEQRARRNKEKRTKILNISYVEQEKTVKRDKNASRHAILEIKFGTAISKLRKNIMFNLVKELNKNRCFKCSLLIETEETFTIEHKVAWQPNKSKELFWELENIAFSHTKCNIANVRKSEK